MPNISAIAALMLLPVAGLIGSPASKADRLSIDFEQGAELADYERLDAGLLDAAVVPREAGVEGHVPADSQPATPATSCGVRLEGPVTLVKNLVLSFDYRTEIEPGFEGVPGDDLLCRGKQWFWQSDAFSAEWRRGSAFGSLRPWRGCRPAGLVFSAISSMAG